MINRELQTLKLRLIVLLTLVVVIFMATFEAFNHYKDKDEANYYLEELSDRTVLRLSENLVLPLWEVDSDWVRRIIHTEMRDHRIQAITIKGDGGLRISKARDSEGFIVKNSHHKTALNQIYRKKEILHNQEPIGSVEIYVTRQFMLKSLTKELIDTVITTTLLIFLMIGFLILALNKIVIKPLLQLLESTQAVAGGDYTHQIKIKRYDEIGMLAEGFNVMQTNIQLREKERDQVTVDLLKKTAELENANKKLELHQEHLEQLVEKRTQESTRARNVANQANQAKSIFLANMSHELRTPLNAVLGFSELMTRDKEITQKQRESLGIINRSGHHLLTMINDVLDLSKIESGGMTLNIVTVDLFSLLYDVEMMMRPRTENKGLNLLVNKNTGLAQYIQVDEGKLRQVLINLLGNAIKFTEHGQVTMEVNSTPYKDNLNLEFEIKDTGVGISEDNMKSIFHPFVQVGRSPSRQKGTGLGLAITHRLVGLMDGDIRAESKLNKGSTFQFNIIVKPSSANQLINEDVDETRVIGIADDGIDWRILVVDDVYDNRLLLRHYLQDVGFNVREAANGEEAIKQFESWKPQFIWMDMRMPVMDGYTAVARIRNLPGGDVVKIVAITASVLIDQRSLIIGCGCDDVVYKPFKAKEIFDAMAQYLSVKFLNEDEKEERYVEPVAVAIPTAATLRKLPKELLLDLQQAATRLDEKQLQILLVSVAMHDTVLRVGLEVMINDFRFDKIISLCEMALEEI
ncbi:MAG: ATP-binding protein [Nitrosomonas sp.]|nr:ATP-binding protein [Nitrosomonas sp.]